MRAFNSSGRAAFRGIRENFEEVYAGLTADGVPETLDGRAHFRVSTAFDCLYVPKGALDAKFGWPQGLRANPPSTVEVDPILKHQYADTPRRRELQDWASSQPSGWPLGCSNQTCLRVYLRRLNLKDSGLQERFGHYFRHLFLAVSYVDRQPDSLLSQAQKYDYVKAFRAQLSSDEQLFLLLNSLTPRGESWWLGNGMGPETSLMAAYRMVRNIPEEVFRTTGYGQNLLKRFDSVESYKNHRYFEWQEALPEMHQAASAK